jgi:hypothetical protein
MNPYIPPPVQGNGVDRNHAVLVRQVIEPSEALHVFRVLIHAMQKDHHRIVLLRVVAFRQANHEAAVHIVDRHRFLCLLRHKDLSHPQNH